MLPRQSGFSLLEALVVLALAALLTTASTPLVKPILEEARLRSEARILAETIEELSKTAQFSGTRTALAITTSGFQAYRKSVSGIPFLSRKFEHGVTADRTTTLTLSPSGAVSPESIVLRRENRRCMLTVALRGRVHVVC